MSAPRPATAKPRVLVLRHTLEDGPSYLGRWLDEQGVLWDCPCAEAGDAYPQTLDGFAALAVLGGAWSANDDRPSLHRALSLLRQALAQNVPVLGHCLGGQLLARALGGRVAPAPQPEIGWLSVTHDGSALARQWLGASAQTVVFQWHHDQVVHLPAAARVLAASAACSVQAFAVGPHLGMQFHVEIDADKLAQWVAQPGALYPQARARHPDTVQALADIQASTPGHLPASQALARHIYGAWRRHWRLAA